MADRVAVQAVGLKELRRDVRRQDKEVGKELQVELRQVVRGVAAEAEGNVNRSGGSPSFTYRGAAVGTRGIVRSAGRAPFAARFVEFGFHPRGSTTFVPGTNPVGRAIERREDQIVDGIGDAIDRAAQRCGWR